MVESKSSLNKRYLQVTETYDFGDTVKRLTLLSGRSPFETLENTL